ncbi:hypothetical protein F511_18722 [Dorcoceras hygrometricum]|uniref:Uncharacterized protein n=1 Tax=Dorcoceras hygrometricum TaxID=472368 RepID=A0A2Z7ADX4_9LAMI|nr:hypothetical protein F511_18722 [Dorcoceras hygrometricum]
MEKTVSKSKFCRNATEDKDSEDNDDLRKFKPVNDDEDESMNKKSENKDAKGFELLEGGSGVIIQEEHPSKPKKEGSTRRFDGYSFCKHPITRVSRRLISVLELNGCSSRLRAGIM